MVFSSNLFLYLFLPLVLGGYFLTPKLFKNLFLFLASSLFYVWGAKVQVVLLYSYIAVNYLLGRAIASSSIQRAKVGYLVLGVVYDLALLGYFKYSNFFLENLDGLGDSLGLKWHFYVEVVLPVGISFFTFQAISYLVEVYRKQEEAQTDVVQFALFLSLFPHLVAGPVVRYSDIRAELGSRFQTIDLFFEGIVRFSIGLGKKVLIANAMGKVADQIFSLPQGELTMTLAWVGVLAYTFQIYFDFSGYSDMAIGLARFFGFHFPENFNYPYSSRSMTEFWRRWHMTLSRWFRDFLYIPLGGNQHGNWRTYRNLFIVFILCGLWHGAKWNFAVWGLYHGLLLILERWMKMRFTFEPSGALGLATTFVLVMIGWVFFRSDSLEHAVGYLNVMFLGTHSPATQFRFFEWDYYVRTEQIVLFAVAFLLSVPRWPEVIPRWVDQKNPVWIPFRGLASIIVLGLSMLYLSTSGFNPFIYFRF